MSSPEKIYVTEYWRVDGLVASINKRRTSDIEYLSPESVQKMMSDAFHAGIEAVRNAPNYKVAGTFDWRDAMEVSWAKFLESKKEEK